MCMCKDWQVHKCSTKWSLWRVFYGSSMVSILTFLKIPLNVLLLRAAVTAGSKGNNLGLARAGRHPLISRGGKCQGHTVSVSPCCVLAQPRCCPLESLSVCLFYIYLPQQHNKYQPVWAEGSGSGNRGCGWKINICDDVYIWCLVVLTRAFLYRHRFSCGLCITGACCIFRFLYSILGRWLIFLFYLSSFFSWFSFFLKICHYFTHCTEFAQS